MTLGLEVKNLVKRYRKTEVLRDINFQINEGEFLVLVGPSGCGKSTLLRMLAGLEETSAGSIFIKGTDVTNLPPAARNVSMVFQDYALYPHMTVLENLEFGLKNRKIPADERKVRIDAAVKILHIEDLLKRRPAQLSGGQRQRIAIGRTIVRKPDLFLFDEPLSNLDARLRAEMRVDLADLQKTLGITAVYVTHDQVEAMTLADRIVVLNQGRIQQIDTPLGLYEKPANKFVASFIGSPAMNFFTGELQRTAGDTQLKLERFTLNWRGSAPAEAGRYCLGLRPEALSLGGPGKEDLRARITHVERQGFETHLALKAGSLKLIMRSADAEASDIMSHKKTGEEVGICLDHNAAHWFHSDDEGQRVDLQPKDNEPPESESRSA